MKEVPNDRPGSPASKDPGIRKQGKNEAAGALSASPPGAAAVSGLLPRSAREGAAWYLWCIDPEPGGNGQGAPPSLPPLLSSPPCGIYDVFRRQLVNLYSLLGIVEEKMTALSNYYRASMGATRLQLCAWAYPKGSPPRSLCWIRLTRRNPELDDQEARVLLPKRRRWYHRLKIENRTDMRKQIYFNGMTGSRGLVMQFYERAVSLTKAHAKIARRAYHLVRTCRGALKRSDTEWLETVSRRIHQDPAANLLRGSGTDVLYLSWALAKSVELCLDDLNLYLGRLPEGRIRLLSRPDWRNESYLPGRAPIKVRWLFQDPLTGRTSHSLRELTRRDCPGMPEGDDASDARSGEMLRCMVAMEEVLGGIRKIGDRMEEIRGQASDFMDGSDPLEEYYVPAL